MTLHPRDGGVVLQQVQGVAHLRHAVVTVNGLKHPSRGRLLKCSKWRELTITSRALRYSEGPGLDCHNPGVPGGVQGFPLLVCDHPQWQAAVHPRLQADLSGCHRAHALQAETSRSAYIAALIRPIP